MSETKRAQLWTSNSWSTSITCDGYNEESRENDKTQRLYRIEAAGKETRERKNG